MPEELREYSRMCWLVHCNLKTN